MWWDVMWCEHSTHIPGLKMHEDHKPWNVNTSRNRKKKKKETKKQIITSDPSECSRANIPIGAQQRPILDFWPLEL